MARNSRIFRAFVLAMAAGATGLAFAIRSPVVEREGERDEARRLYDGARGHGLRPWTMDMSHLGASYRALRSARPRLLRASTIPSSWDSRDHGWVTPVKDQGSYCTCWTFSALASLESSLLKNGRGAWDFSENHMATHRVGFLWGYDDGGNNQMSTALLASWHDPLLEEQDPYGHPDAVVTSSPAFHVQNVIWLPKRESKGLTSGDDALKRAVMEYGAVSVGYYHAASCYKSSLGSHYMADYATYQQTPGSDGGHAVTLIGWDDAYPSNNFRSPPPGNGAFLCKNSWGASSGTNGCIWISYYDDQFCFMPPAAFPEPEPTNNYGRVYEHDPCGQVVAWNVYLGQADQDRGGKENWGANMFTAGTTGIVEAVGFYSMAAGTTYELRVYNACGITPASGTLVSSQSGTLDHAGYVTLPLAVPVPIATCPEKFAVVVHLETPGYDYPLPVQSQYDEYGELFCTNVAHLGESFLSSNGVDWVDFQRYPGANRTENLCIKAYTRYGADGEEVHFITAVDPVDGRVTMRSGESVTFSVETADENTTIEWTLDNVPQATGVSSFVYATTPADHGTHELVCRVSQGGVGEVRSWTLAVTSLLHVDAASVVVDPDGSSAKPFPSINAALVGALPGDEVTVAAGTYAECVTPYAAIPIVSEAGPLQTIIDGGGTNRCYCGAYSAAASLTGFTLMNGSVCNGSAGNGGGAYGGILSNCVITACIANNGGGAFASTMAHCTVYGNVAYNGYGGGVYGGCTVKDSIVWGNYYQDWNGNYSEENWYRWDTGSFQYTCTSSKPSGTGNINSDPLFVDAENGDFRLRVGSPCLAAASDGGNMGAWQGEGVVTYTITATATNGGRVEPASVVVVPGGSATFTALDDHPFQGFITNGVNVEGESKTFTWADIRADGTLTANFQSVEFHVDAVNGDDAGNGWTTATAKRTLQAAVDAANDGETVWVAPGVYDAVAPNRQNLSIRSTGGPGVTVIDGGGTARCYDDYGLATLDGFTLVNGAAAGDYGGGAYYGTLVGCVVSNCTAKYGGGVAGTALTNCLITGCRASYHGGGAYESLLVNCTVAKNSAARYGGGAYLQQRGGALNTVTAENSSDRGSTYGNDVYGNLYWYMVNSLSDQDARFVDSANGDFRLKADSPAVDAGSNAGVLAATDLAGNPRLVGAKVDMGAYERQLDLSGGWPDPQVAADDSASAESNKVTAAMASAGFPAASAAAITRLADYSAITEWANRRGVSLAAAASGSATLVSAAMGAAGLLELTDEDARIASLSSIDGGWRLCLNLPDYDPDRVNLSLIKAAVGVKGTADLNVPMSAEGLSVQVTPGTDNVEVMVTPPASATNYFFRTTLR